MSNYPTLKKLIDETSDSEILSALSHIDDRSTSSYQRVLASLRNMKPSCDDEFMCVLKPTENDDVHVFGTKGNDPSTYCFDLTPWNEWLGLHIQVKNLDLSSAQIIAWCLFEMTFYSFNESLVMEFKDTLTSQVDILVKKYEKS